MLDHGPALPQPSLILGTLLCLHCSAAEGALGSQVGMLRSRRCAAAGTQPKCIQKLEQRRKRFSANDHHPWPFPLLLMQSHFSSFGLESSGIFSLEFTFLCPSLPSSQLLVSLLSNRPFTTPSTTKLVTPGHSWLLERDGLCRDRIVSSESKCFRELRPLILVSVHPSSV